MVTSRYLLLPTLAFIMGLSPCGTARPQPIRPEAATGSERSAIATEVPGLSEQTPEELNPEVAEPTPSVHPTMLQRVEPPISTPISPAIAAHIHQIAARAELSANVFAKMGGSSVESHAFLHCFASDRTMELAGFENLRSSIEFFRAGRAADANPFRRASLAAQVGWSLRQGLAGRPSRAIQEARVTRARWALAFWGGNDVQGRNPRRYAERLLRLIVSLERRGVVPLLAATTPRGDEELMDGWAKRYNQVTRGLAEALNLPYIDFYRAIDPLPHHGLAGDGVHPNVLLDGHRGRPCNFTELGLQRGQNQRNLKTMQMLDAVRHVLEQPVDSASPTASPAPTGTPEGAVALTRIPFAEVVSPTQASFDGYACERASASPGPERVYRIEVDQSIALEWRIYRGTARLAYLGQSFDPNACVSWGENELAIVFSPGVHYVAVELNADTNAEADEQPILIIDEPIL